MIKITLSTAAHSYVCACRDRNSDLYDAGIALCRMVLDDFIAMMKRYGRDAIDMDVEPKQ